MRSDHDLLSGQWSYMPGTTKEGSVLLVKNTGLAIVEQDGSGRQPNPPVNEYGTYVRLGGDSSFSVTATMSNLQGRAELALYSKPPLIADEFRIEPPSVRLAVNPSSQELEVDIWPGSGPGDNTATQIPSWHDACPIPHLEGSLTVEFKRLSDDQFLFIVNGTQLGCTSDHDVFRDQQVWFGLDAQNPWVLSSLHAQALADGSIQVMDASQAASPGWDSHGLQALAARKRPGFRIGSAAALAPLVSDSGYRNILIQNFGAITLENSGKWQSTEPKEGYYTFQEASGLVDFALKHNMVINGHALVWAEANPHWVQNLPLDRDRVRQVMVNHIQAEVGFFKGKVSSWDVVNEPINNSYDGTNNPLRDNVWLRAMGPEYIEIALRAAHAADPQAQLYINMYGAENDDSYWDALLALVTKLKAQDVPLTGVGFQAHVYDMSDDAIDPSQLSDHIQALAELGLKSRKSEMDVNANETDQAKQYCAILETCLQNEDCVSFTVWGFDNQYAYWQDDDYVLQPNGRDLLWTDPQHPTPSVDALKSLLTE